MQLMPTGYLTCVSQRQERGVGAALVVTVPQLNEFCLLKAGKIRSCSTKCESDAFI